MQNWLKYHKKRSKDYISNMMSFSDWLQPYPENGNTRGDTSSKLIGTAFFAHSAKLTAKVAGALGKTEDQAKYEDLYNTVATAFENKFFDETGKVKEVPETQTSYLLALAFDLISEDKKANAKKFLLEKIEEADNHLRTGFLGTPLLSEVLDETGEIDLMYKLLFNETYPSWFYSINQGATTIWERWNSYSKEKGFNPMNMNSLNHYAYGAIGQWMYERIAGIAPQEAGYKVIKIAPQVRQPLNSASAELETPYGKVASAWEVKNDIFTLEVTIPPNTTAKVVMPGTAEFIEESNNIKKIGTENGSVELEVQPGTYTFQSMIK